MKIAPCLLAAVGFASAHNTFPKLIADGVTSAEWEFVRRTANKWSHEGVTNVNSDAIRCLEEQGRPEAGVKDVKAGSTIGFGVSSPIRHIGPVQFYMAKVPAGQDVNSWPATGNIWFKVKQVGPEKSGSTWTWPTQGKTEVMFELPPSLPDGGYIVRVEQIAIHDAGYVGGAQFYIGCGQINVTGGGNGNPGPTVSFPGAYSATDPGILIDLNGKPPVDYQFPGPEVWQG